MKLSCYILLAVFLTLAGSFDPSDASFAQENRRERRGGPGGERSRPPWMQEGPRGDRPRPPWMQEGPGDDRGRRDDPERNERFLGMLRSMDTNRNGILEPNEIPEYRRGFVSMVVTRLGGDPNKRIDLNALARQASRSGSSTPQTQRVSVSSNSSTVPLATDPLVPYFGEKEPTTAPVPAFGQREPEVKAPATTSQSAIPALSQSDRILRSAREIMNRYDKNKNGTLDKDKGEWVSSLPFKPDPADKNRDGRISMSELISALGGKSGAATGAAAVSTRQSTAYERIPSGMPDWFFERDKDQDAQLTMVEYANGQIWTEAMVEEFEFLDRNSDGVATANEIFSSLKEFDEKKKLQEELAKREIERRKGTALPKESEKPSGDAPKPDAKPDAPPKEGAPPPGPPNAAPENRPDWKPAAKAEPGAIPTTGPYAEGSSDRRSGPKRTGPRRGK